MNTQTPHNHSTNSEKVFNSMPDSKTIEGVSDALSHLGDPTRLKIFWLLCHCEECVINIASLMNMSSPAISHHLRILKSSNLIESKRIGKEMFYKAADTDIVNYLHKAIEEIAKINCPD